MKKQVLLLLILPFFWQCGGGVSKPFVGAGILPYCVKDGKLMLGLGFDPDKKAWTDFGGSPEKVASLSQNSPRWETQRETAMRECSEESRYLIGRASIGRGLDEQRFFDHPRRAYRIYTLKIDWFPPERFLDQPVPVSNLWLAATEKTAFRWVELSQLQAMVASATDRGRVVFPGSENAEDFLYSSLYDSLVEQFAAENLSALFPTTPEEQQQ